MKMRTHFFAKKLKNSYKFITAMKLACKKMNVQLEFGMDLLLGNRFKYMNITTLTFNKKSNEFKGLFLHYFEQEDDLIAILNNKINHKHIRYIKSDINDVTKLDGEIYKVMESVFENINFNE